jgi:hypothetical protein
MDREFCAIVGGPAQHGTGLLKHMHAHAIVKCLTPNERLGPAVPIRGGIKAR